MPATTPAAAQTQAKSRYVMIGGFLGAGKTTAILKLAGHLTARGKRVGLITNDQSVDLVDTARVRSAGYPVEEITGGCFCCKFDSLVDASRELTRQTAPDVLVAEPVGSCTDLKATVSYPLRQLYGDAYQVAPLSVVVDPVRCARVLGLKSDGRNFSEKVLYVYRKQLEEAEIIVVNKVDLIDPAARRDLAAALKAEYPRAAVMEVSCETGEGLAAWFDRIVGGDLGSGRSMDVDYDVYADGEALLGWLNARVQLRAEAEFDGNAFVTDLARRLRDQLASRDVEIAHLKMTLAPRHGAGPRRDQPDPHGRGAGGDPFARVPAVARLPRHQPAGRGRPGTAQGGSRARRSRPCRRPRRTWRSWRPSARAGRRRRIAWRLPWGKGTDNRRGASILPGAARCESSPTRKGHR